MENYFSNLLNVNVTDEFREPEIHTAEPLIPEPNFNEF